MAAPADQDAAGAPAGWLDPGPRNPRQQRARETYERLLDVAGLLLEEVGIERISTNMVAARAKVTPPALYRYFEDKYALLTALGRRLMDHQNIVLYEWIARHPPSDGAVLEDHLAELLRITARVTAAQPGSVWILRALHAVPQLAHVRLESHRIVTMRLCDAYRPALRELDDRALERRVRMIVELGFAAIEMIGEDNGLSADEIIAEAAALLGRGSAALRDAQ